MGFLGKDGLERGPVVIFLKVWQKSTIKSEKHWAHRKRRLKENTERK